MIISVHSLLPPILPQTPAPSASKCHVVLIILLTTNNLSAYTCVICVLLTNRELFFHSVFRVHSPVASAYEILKYVITINITGQLQVNCESVTPDLTHDYILELLNS